MSDTHSAGDQNEAAWVTEVLSFWFDELGPPQWFASSDETDARIRERFVLLHRDLVARYDQLAATPRALLATVIVLDQFSRHLYRATPQAFAADAVARQLARSAISQGFDREMTDRERLFLYMPFEHSEDRNDQAVAVELIARLGNDEWTRDAVAHRATIDRFGRFPHRNATLGRTSSADELALLQQTTA
jgi:uncharacterized protein (DUF924 family)